MAQWLMNPRSMRLQVRSLALLSVLTIGIAVNCGVGCRHGLDPVLLWLWCRPVARAPIGPLAWEPPYAAGAAQEMAKSQKAKKKKKQKKPGRSSHRGSAVANLTSIYEDEDLIPGLAQQVKDLALL